MNHPPASRNPRASLIERRRRERRVLLIGLAISLVVHVVAVGVFGGLLSSPPEQPVPPSTPRLHVPPSGMRAVEITGVADPGAERAERPDEPVRPAEPEPTRRQPEAETPAPAVVVGPADDRTAADRLAPRVVDPRLYEPLVVLPWEPTFSDVEARIRAAVELMSDSALAAAEAAVRRRDWTVEDAQGGRWGISPGELHLGDITVPLPIAFPVSAEAAREAALWYELEQQAERFRILESFEERVRAIRERRQREREEARGDNGGG